MKLFIKETLGGISAGICITLGCAVFLGLPENKYAGAALFAVALLCICYKGYNLYTGKIGFIPEVHDKNAIISLFAGLLGNLAAVTAFGLLLRVGVPGLGETAEIICESKLSQNAVQTFLRGVFCGMLMYLAVSVYREHKTVTGIIFCIPVFILSGFEHSVADACYFAVAMTFSPRVIIFIALAIVGNTVGAMILPLIKMIFPEKANENGEK